MQFQFDHKDIHFSIELERITEPQKENVDIEDWPALEQGEIELCNLYITSSKGNQTLKHAHFNQPLAIEPEDRLEELECLIYDTPLFEKIFYQWELEEKIPQGGKPPWGK